VPIRYDVESGAEWLLPFARKKLTQLKEHAARLGIGILQKWVDVDTGERINVATSHGFDRISIYATASDAPMLFHWREYNDTVAMAPRRVRLLTAPTPEQIAAGATPLSAVQTITAKELEPLEAGLAFDIAPASRSGTGADFSGGNSLDFLLRPTLTLSRLTSLFEMLVRNENPFAREVFKWLLSRVNVRFQPDDNTQLVFSHEDCLLSRADASGDFYMLIGTFPGGSQVVTPENGDASFVGAVVPWSAFRASMTPVPDAVSRWGVILSEAGARVLTNGEYTLGGNLDLSSDVSHQRALVRDTVLPSPFTAMYRYAVVDSESAGGTTTFSQRVVYYLHTLSSAGAITISSAADDVNTGELAYHLHSVENVGTDASLSQQTADLTFFSGDEFVKVGEHSQTAVATFTGPITVTNKSCLPLTGPLGSFLPQDSTQYAILTYLPEYDLVIGREGTVSRVTDEFLYQLTTTTAINSLIATSTSGWSQGLYPSGIELDQTTSVVGTSPNQVVTVDGRAVQFGEGPYYSSNAYVGYPFPQIRNRPEVGTGAANTIGLGGVFWHRDGPMGVFLYRTPTTQPDKTTRSAAVLKYQRVYRGEVGYRPDEAQYESLDVLLERVVSRTTVLVNNFASPALLPWLDDGIIGVIL
jgi:hypothetical protein